MEERFTTYNFRIRFIPEENEDNQETQEVEISIANDLSKEDREEQKIRSSHLKTAKNQFADANIRGHKLIISENIYAAKDLLVLQKLRERYRPFIIIRKFILNRITRNRKRKSLEEA